MASFNGNIDLLSLNGAKVMQGIDEKNPQRGYVCIPVDVNEIKVQASRNDASKQIATIRVNMWPFSEQYKQKVRQSALERGDQNPSVPTHEMQMSFSTDYIKAVAKAFPALVQQVKDANKDRNPDIVNQDPQDENTHLFKAIRTRMNKRIANLYQPQAQPQQQAYTPQFAQAAQPTAYVAPAADAPVFNPQEEYDLPF